jgi:hypothetical protein
MKLPIDDRYRIDSDEYQWRVSRSRVVKGELKWEPISFHPSLESAVQAYADRCLRLSEAEGVAEAKAEVDRLVSRLCQALTPRFEVREAGERLAGPAP